MWATSDHYADWELVYVKGFPSEASLHMPSTAYPEVRAGDRLDVLREGLPVWRGWVSYVGKLGGILTLSAEGFQETCRRIRVGLGSPYALSVRALLNSLASMLSQPERLGVSLKVVDQLKTLFMLPYGQSATVDDLLGMLASMFPEGRVGAGFNTDGEYEMGVFKRQRSLRWVPVGNIVSHELSGAFGSCLTVVGGVPAYANLAPNGDFSSSGLLHPNLVKNWDFADGSTNWSYNPSSWELVSDGMDGNYAFKKTSSTWNHVLEASEDLRFAPFTNNGVARKATLVGGVLVRLDPAVGTDFSVRMELDLKTNDTVTRTYGSSKNYVISRLEELVHLCIPTYVDPGINGVRVRIYASQGVVVDGVQLKLVEYPAGWETIASNWENAIFSPSIIPHLAGDPAVRISATEEEEAYSYAQSVFIQATVDSSLEYYYLRTSDLLDVPPATYFDAYVFFTGNEPKFRIEYYNAEGNFGTSDTYNGSSTDEIPIGDHTLYRRRYSGVWSAGYPLMRLCVGHGGSYASYPATRGCKIIGIVVINRPSGFAPLFPYTSKLRAQSRTLSSYDQFGMHTYEVGAELSTQEGLTSFLTAWEARRGLPAESMVLRTDTTYECFHTHTYSALHEGKEYVVERAIVSPRETTLYLDEDILPFRDILYRMANPRGRLDPYRI